MDGQATDTARYAQRGLVLFSLCNYISLIDPLLVALKPGRVCEIGVEGGLFTGYLLDACRRLGAAYTGVDPTADGDLAGQVEARGGALVRLPSLEALEGLSRQDVYFLDGDHNHHTVAGELRQILERARRGRLPLVFVHDVGWPCDRRDMYFQPSHVPLDRARPSAPDLGAALDRDDLIEGGLAPSGDNYRFALARGGPGNGVLTAVEDVLAEFADLGLAYFSIPSLFGLGVLHGPDLPGAFRKALASLRAAAGTLGGLLGLLERNRIALVLDGQEARREAARELALLEERLRTGQAREAALKAELERQIGLVEHNFAQVEKLKCDLRWLQGVSATYWGQVETLKASLAWQRDVTTGYWREAQECKSDLEWQKGVTDGYWREAQELKRDLAWQQDVTTEHWRRAEALQERLDRELATPLWRIVLRRLGLGGER